LENYLKKQAGQDVKRKVAACFVLEGENEIIKGYGLGELLLADALKRAYAATVTVGACAVVADPINEHARNFYGEFGFIFGKRPYVHSDADHRSIPLRIYSQTRIRCSIPVSPLEN
jgi:predicted GNAT family N-acyltransferase